MKTAMQFKVFPSVFLVFFLIQSAFSQEPLWAWAKSDGGPSSEYANSVCTDALGNVYVTGTFQGETMTIGEITLYNNAEGSLDIFLAKYDQNGNVIWAISEGGGDADYAYGICTDPEGNVIITGYFHSDSFLIGTSEFVNNSEHPNCPDIFLVKYNPDGIFLWAKSPYGLGCEEARSIAADSQGNVYMVGYYWQHGVTFGSHTLNNPDSQIDGFLTKYDPDGNEVWAKRIGGSHLDLCTDVFIDIEDKILVTGSFEHAAQFGDVTVVSPNEATYQEIFAAKFSSDGNNIWAECAEVPYYGNYASGNGIASDAEGNVYITGYFQHSLAFGEDTLSTSGNMGIFLAKYDSSGTPIWGRTPGGTDHNYGNDVCVDSDGHIFVAGYFSSGFVNFDSFPLINSNTGYNEAFLAAYNINGDAIWANSMGGQDEDYGINLAAGLNNEVYLAGYFESYSLDFSNTTVVNSGSHDFYLARLSYDAALNASSENKLEHIKVFPNPFHDVINITADARSMIEIYDVSSRKVFAREFFDTSTLDLSRLSPGVYVYKITSEGMASSGRLVKE